MEMQLDMKFEDFNYFSYENHWPIFDLLTSIIVFINVNKLLKVIYYITMTIIIVMWCQITSNNI